MSKSPEPVASKPPALSSLLRPDGAPVEYMRPLPPEAKPVKPEPPAPIKE